MTSIYSTKPWLKLYPPGLPSVIEPAAPDMLGLFRSAVARAPQGDALLYFDGRLSYAELDALSDAFAVFLQSRGFQRGDRLALYMQNMPHFVIGVLAAWKAGGCAVPINPMYRERELTLMFANSTPCALLCLDQLHADVIRYLPEDVALPPLVITASPFDFQSRDDGRVLPEATAQHPEAVAFTALLDQYNGQKPTLCNISPEDTGFLVYTSGTSGLPKAAILTHGNLVFNGTAIARWYELPYGSPIFGMAPLFHVTGLVGQIVHAIALASPLILNYRYEPTVVLEALIEHRPIFIVGAITAFIGLVNNPAATAEHFSSLEIVLSGGAPLPPAVAADFYAKTGKHILNGYGLTETNAAMITVPLGALPPLDEKSGVLSIGVPEFNTDVWVMADDGSPAPVGEAGELVVSGPNISPGYWLNPEETNASMKPDGFRTGDIGFMDVDGWFYLIDRKKDMINASGYKVWPREVEDVLYAHPAVCEVAVVGVMDAYRGETVKAVVILKPEGKATADDLVAWCKSRMATYKCPRIIELRDYLPKTATGKILRRELR